jgi:hypothetical protein
MHGAKTSILLWSFLDIASSPFFFAAAMSEPSAGVQSAIDNHMTKQCRKFL